MQSRYSDVLQQNIYIDHEAGTIKTEDGVVYDRYETELLKEFSDLLALHKVKKIFRGKIQKGNKWQTYTKK